MPRIRVERREDGNLHVLTVEGDGSGSVLRVLIGARVVDISGSSRVEPPACSQTLTVTDLTGSWEDVDEGLTSESGRSAPDGPTAFVPPSSTSPGKAILAAFASGTAWFQIRYEDVVFIDVTETKSTLTLTWNGSCVTNRSGAYTNAWRSFTGWSLYYTNSLQGWTGSACSGGYTSARVYTDSTFKNGVFCAGYDTWVYKDDVEIVGYQDDTWAGGAAGLSVDEPWWCPPLVWHQTYGGP
jgi:hypothetical protein